MIKHGVITLLLISNTNESSVNRTLTANQA